MHEGVRRGSLFLAQLLQAGRDLLERLRQRLVELGIRRLGSAPQRVTRAFAGGARGDRKSTRLNSSHSQISYAVFCLKNKRATLAASLLVSSNKKYALLSSGGETTFSTRMTDRGRTRLS